MGKARGGRLFKYSKMSDGQINRLIKAFAYDVTAGELASEISISIRSASAIYQRLRERTCHLGYADIDVSDEQLDQMYMSAEFADYAHTRKVKSRGWISKYELLHTIEAFHRYVRRPDPEPRIHKLLIATLTRWPLASIALTSELTYRAQHDNFEETQASRLRSQKDNPNNPFRW